MIVGVVEDVTDNRNPAIHYELGLGFQLLAVKASGIYRGRYEQLRRAGELTGTPAGQEAALAAQGVEIIWGAGASETTDATGPAAMR